VVEAGSVDFLHVPKGAVHRVPQARNEGRIAAQWGRAAEGRTAPPCGRQCLADGVAVVHIAGETSTPGLLRNFAGITHDGRDGMAVAHPAVHELPADQPGRAETRTFTKYPYCERRCNRITANSPNIKRSVLDCPSS
jgi:hypothetical protein